MIGSDLNDTFSAAAAVTATAISNVIDLGTGNTTRDIGAGEPIYLIIKVDVTTASAGGTTIDFTLESDSTADLATSPTVHLTVAAVPKATLVAGYQVVAIALPVGQYERYVGIRYTVAVANLTAGAFTAYLTRQPQATYAYADGIV